MAHYHFHRTAVQHITDLENIINALKAAFILRRPLVMIAAYKMDMTVKLACVVRDRLLIPICKISDNISYTASIIQQFSCQIKIVF